MGKVKTYLDVDVASGACSDTPGLDWTWPDGGWRVLGVDPGKEGAAALITAWPDRNRPRLENVCPLFAKDVLREWAEGAHLVIIEAQQASPQMGRSSAFALGAAYGGVLEAVEGGVARGGGEVVKVFPTAWRGSYGLAGGKAGKSDGIDLVDVLLAAQNGGPIGGSSLVESHDQADAVLLAWWGWRKVLLARVTQDVQAVPTA